MCPTVNFSFQDLKGCTINIMQPQTKQSQQVPELPVLDDGELDQILCDSLDTMPEL